MQVFAHFKTITKHKAIVMRYCFRAGLYWQGLVHDLSKYAPSEFWVGATYYAGNKSPNVLEREAVGYSSSWLHHKGRNRHHFEYWVDNGRDGFIPVDMPNKYLAEMLFDRIAACKTYNGGCYNDASPIEYYNRGFDSKIMHEHTRVRIEMLLTMLAEKGEDATIGFIRKDFLKTDR